MNANDLPLIEVRNLKRYFGSDDDGVLVVQAPAGPSL